MQRTSGAGKDKPLPPGFTPPAHTRSAGHPKAIPVTDAKVQTGALPTFTTDDVEDYLRTNPSPPGEKATRLKHTVSFLPSTDLAQKLQQNFSAEASILCYVEFTDDQPIYVDSATRPDGKALAFKQVYMVFDGRTGDLIVWGGRT
jgi:hypothetical protein